MTGSTVVGDSAVVAEAATVAVVDDEEQCSGFVVGMLPAPLQSCCWPVIGCQWMLESVVGWIGLLQMKLEIRT